MRSGARRGFILATTMLVMTLLTVMLVAALVLISAEAHTTDASYSTSRSLNFAQAGLEAYFAGSHDLTTGSDSTNYGFSGGYARVVAKQLRAPTTGPTRNAVWLVYATGVDSTRSLTRTGTGTRTVARLAYLNGGAIPIHAAYMATNQVYVEDGGNVTGTDSCGVRDTVVLAAYNADINIGAHPRSMKSPTEGEKLKSRQVAYDSIHIDWSRLKTGGGFTTTPPSPGSVHRAYFYDGSLTLAASQTYTGLLVLTGNLTFGDNSIWNGVIIAGGWLRSQTANYAVNGAITTGLNNMTTPGCTTSDTLPCVGPDSLKGSTGPKTPARIRWASCVVSSATATIGYLTPLRNVFMDTWKTY